MPYLPDPNYARSTDLSITEHPKWRASELPDWIEPAEFRAPKSRDDWNDYIKKLISEPGGGGRIRPWFFRVTIPFVGSQ